MGVPRIGRGGGALAALAAQGGIGIPNGLRGPGPLAKILTRPAVELDTRPKTRRQLNDAAAELAQQLGPLPNALGEIATRVRRHCTERGHPPDEELVQQLDALRDRTWELWRAVSAYKVAAHPPKGA